MRRLLAIVLALLCGCVTRQPTPPDPAPFPRGLLRHLSTARFEALKTTRPVVPDTDLNARLNTIMHRIVDAAPRSEWLDEKWECVIFEDPSLYAFSLPGGKIGIFTGLLEATRSDDEIAVVIGREVAIRHLRLTASRMLDALTELAINAPAARSIEDENERNKAALLMTLGLPPYRTHMPYSRGITWEVDRLGVLYAARAGYDPRAALTFWGRLHALAKNTGDEPAYLAMHPSYSKRIHLLQRAMRPAIRDFNHARARLEHADL